jgi:molybdopterin-guanine dinucleotide biosynthesis protein A
MTPGAQAGRVDGRLAGIAAALLTGGASTRMGSDKAGVLLDGIPVATRLSHLLGALFEELLLVGGEPPPGALGRRVADVPGPRCALRGIVSALGATDCERVLVIATDLPLMTPDLVLALVASPEADAVIPRDAYGSHPLSALYRREPLAIRAREHLAANRLAMHELLARVNTHSVEGSDLEGVDPGGQALTNVNTPEELSRVRI